MLYKILKYLINIIIEIFYNNIIIKYVFMENRFKKKSSKTFQSSLEVHLTVLLKNTFNIKKCLIKFRKHF